MVEYYDQDGERVSIERNSIITMTTEAVRELALSDSNDEVKIALLSGILKELKIMNYVEAVKGKSFESSRLDDIIEHHQEELIELGVIKDRGY